MQNMEKSNLFLGGLTLLMSKNKTYPVFENIARKSHFQKKNYEQMYLRSIEESQMLFGQRSNFYKLVLGQSAALCHFETKIASLKELSFCLHNCLEGKKEADQLAMEGMIIITNGATSVV